MVPCVIPLRIWSNRFLNYWALTFLARWCVFVWWLLILLLAAQVTSIHSHSGFNLLLSQLHSLIKHLEEFFGLIITRQTIVEWPLEQNKKEEDNACNIDLLFWHFQMCLTFGAKNDLFWCFCQWLVNRKKNYQEKYLYHCTPYLIMFCGSWTVFRLYRPVCWGAVLLQGINYFNNCNFHAMIFQGSIFTVWRIWKFKLLVAQNTCCEGVS